jgi:hypothetical protein
MGITDGKDPVQVSNKIRVIFIMSVVINVPFGRKTM